MFRRIRRLLSFLGLAISLIFFAKAVEIMNRQANSIMATRACLAESFSVLANTGVDDMRSFRTLIQDAVSRNPELVSIAIRNNSGRYLASTDDHEATWPQHEVIESNDQFMAIPLINGHREWGQLELVFVPIAELTPETFASVELRNLALFTSPLCLLFVTMLIRFLFRLRSKRKQAEAKNEIETTEEILAAQTEFLSKFNYELVPPMNVIRGYTEILRRGMEESPQQRKEYLNWIYNSSTHIIELASDVADLASIEAGEVECEIKDCSPSKLISDVVAMTNSHASRQGLYLRCHVDGEIPESVQTDPTRVHRIMMNLVGSSIRHTKEGGVTIACRYNNPNSELEFRVMDTGVGIAESELRQIFESASDGTLGVGETYFGFAICKKFAEALGGSVSAESQLGKGSTFTVRLKCEPSKAAKMLAPGLVMQKIQETDLSGSTKSLGKIRPSKILVVDDADTTRHLVRLILTRSGLEIDEAANGQEAIEKIAVGEYDLILMDMKMPVMDGYAATQTLRNNGYAKPIIALTASTRVIDRQRCMAAGCNDISPKPIDFDKLHSLLLTFLGEEQQLHMEGAFQDREFDISQLSGSAKKRTISTS